MFKPEVRKPQGSGVFDPNACLQWLVEYFGRLTADQSMACMQEMLRVNIRQNLQIVIQIATKYSDILGPVKLIEMFESFKSSEGKRK
jgi:clathrin heavy chain